MTHDVELEIEQGAYLGTIPHSGHQGYYAGDFGGEQ